MSEGERRAWGWVASLRDGGTTPWCDWSGEADRSSRFLPGAQQLELLRRLNLEGRPDAALVERVLASSAAGRGSPDLELVGAAEPSRFGPRPVDPGDLPDDELLRVAVNLLAEDVVAAGAAPPSLPATPRPWRRRYRLVGAPWLAQPLREELTLRGYPPGGSRPLVLVLGTDLATMVALAFTARAFDEGGYPWDEWLGSIAAERRVPPRADLQAMARRWAGRVGVDRVRVVLDPVAVPGQLGLGRVQLRPPPVVPADGVDLVRRVGVPLALLVRPARRAELLRHGLGPRVVAAGGAPLAVPPEHLPWLQDRAARVRGALLSAGYAVVGDPERLVPTAPGSGGQPGTQPAPERVLRLATRLLLEGRVRPGTTGGGGGA